MSSEVDLGCLTVAMWSIALGAIGAAVTGVILANTDFFLSKAEKASLGFLEDIDLQTLDKAKNVQGWGAVEEKWGHNHGGAETGMISVQRGMEAAELSSLKPQLNQLGVPLYAVVKENIGTEVQDFQPYFDGEIFLDEKKQFYGPQKRKMLFLGILRWSVWKNFFRAWWNGFSGNIEGEGIILGGVFVIGPGKQGVLLEHREKEFGDKVSLPAVLEAVKKMK